MRFLRKSRIYQPLSHVTSRLSKVGLVVTRLHYREVRQLTRNQVEYFKQVEASRSNRENERLRDAELANKRSELSETRRANRARESAASASLSETKRMNDAQMIVAQRQADEAVRSNMAREAIQQQQANEQARSNFATAALTAQRDAETARSHRASEALSDATRLAGLEAARINASVGFANIAEQERSHRVTEEQTEYRDTQTLLEKQRANIANEVIQGLKLEEQYYRDELLKDQTKINALGSIFNGIGSALRAATSIGGL